MKLSALLINLKNIYNFFKTSIKRLLYENFLVKVDLSNICSK